MRADGSRRATLATEDRCTAASLPALAESLQRESAGGSVRERRRPVEPGERLGIDEHRGRASDVHCPGREVDDCAREVTVACEDVAGRNAGSHRGQQLVRLELVDERECDVGCRDGIVGDEHHAVADELDDPTAASHDDLRRGRVRRHSKACESAGSSSCCVHAVESTRSAKPTLRRTRSIPAAARIVDRAEAPLDVMTQQRVEAARDAVEQDHRLGVRPGQLETRRVVLQRLRHDVHEERGDRRIGDARRGRAQHADHLDRHLLAEELDPSAEEGEDLDVAARERPNVGVGIGFRKPRGSPRPCDQRGFDSGRSRDLVECQPLRSPHSAIVDASSGSSPGFATRRSSIVAPRPTRYSRSASCCAAFSASVRRGPAASSSAGRSQFPHPCSIGRRAARTLEAADDVGRAMQANAWRDNAAGLDAYPHFG